MTISELQNASKIMIGSQEAECIYIGEELIWRNNKLPSNAVEIEYIESTGTQYIDLLFKPTTNKVTMQTNIAITDTSQDSTIIGTVDSETTLLRFYPLGFSNSKFYSCNFSGKWNSAYSLNSSNISSNTFYDVESTIGNTVSLIVNNNTYTQSRTEGYSGEKPLYLFARNESPAGHFAKCKMKYLKIYESDILIIDLIPIRIGQIGYMYDKISKQIFENAGTGNFVLGSDKLPPEYTKLEYISSTNGGNQYIDLGIKLYEELNTQYDIAIKFIISSTNTESQATMFNCQDSNNSPWPGTYIRKNNSGTNIIGRYIGGSAKDNTIGQLDNIIELPVQTSPNKNVTDVNNNNSTHLYGTGLFCSFSDTNNTPQRYCNGTLYYFKLFVEGQLVRDMVPCKNSNNIVGLYDLVNNIFYTSPNGALFVGGPEI